MNRNKKIGSMANNVNKKPLDSRKKTKIAIIIACVVLAYCTFLFIKLIQNPTETFIVEQGKIYKEESVVGYILRDEQVIENEASGRKDCTIKSRRKESC